MGYESYEVTRPDGKIIWAGYGHRTRCEKKGCQAKIDRGLAHLCGATPGGDEWGCGSYFCGKHLCWPGSRLDVPEYVSGLCEVCWDRHAVALTDEQVAP